MKAKLDGQDSHFVCRRHSEGFLVSVGILDKRVGLGGVYFDGNTCVLLRGSLVIDSLWMICEAIVGEKKSASWSKLEDGEKS